MGSAPEAKREMSRKTKLSVNRSIFVPTLTYGQELWVVTEITRSWVQAAEMSFVRSQLRWVGHLTRMPPGSLPGQVFRARPTGRRPREDPGLLAATDLHSSPL